MNIWYTVEDISLGYKLSVRDLRLLVKHGDIWSLMFTRGKVKIVLIPDSELWKLENYRRAGEYPHYDVSHQMKRFISHQWNIEPPELDTRIRRKFASYADYMNSYEWLRKRMAVMKRDSYRCVKCGGE